MGNLSETLFLNQYQTFREHQALKVAIACLLSAFIALYWHLLYAFMAPISSFVIMTVYLDQTIEKGLQRIAGPILFSIAGLLILSLFQFSSFALLVMIFLMLFLGGYLAFTSRFGYAGLLGSIIGSIVIYQGYTSPHIAKEIALHFVLNTIIGVLVAWFITWGLWPFKPKKDFIPILSKLFIYVGEQFFKQPKLPINFFSYTARCLLRSQASLSKEKYSYYQSILTELNQANRASKTLVSKMNWIENHIHLEIIQNLLSELRALMKEQYKTLSNAILLEKKAFEAVDIQDWLSRFSNTLIQARHDALWKAYSVKTSIQVFALETEVKIYQDYLKNLYNTIENKPQKNLLVEKNSNRDPYLKQAFKFALTIVLMLLLSTRFSFLGGIQAVITVAVIASQTNIGRSDQRSKLRLYGAMIGALVGIAFLIIAYHTYSLIVFSLLFFVGIFSANYFAVGSEEKGYAAAQAGVMLSLIMLGSLGPSNDLTIPLQRTLGVFSGLILSAIINRFVFPVHPIKILKNKINSALFESAKFINTFFSSPRSEKGNIPALSEEDPLMSDIKHLFNNKSSVRLYESTMNNMANLAHILNHMADSWKFAKETLPAPIQKNFSTYLNYIEKALLALAQHKDTSFFDSCFLNYLNLLNDYRNKGVTLSLSDHQIKGYTLLSSNIYDCISFIRKMIKLQQFRDTL